MARKFIITESGEIVYGNVEFHMDLRSTWREKVYGGGLWYINEETKTIELSGKSCDFGAPQFDKLHYIPEEWKEYKITYEGEEVIPVEPLEKVVVPKKMVENVSSPMFDKIKTYNPSKGFLHEFKFNDGYECKAKNKKEASKKHRAWKRKASK